MINVSPFFQTKSNKKSVFHAYFIKIFSITCFFLLGFNSAFGSEKMVDSLIQELNLIEEDSQKFDLLITITKEFSDFDPDQSILYGKKALDFAKQIGSKKKESKALCTIGIAYGRSWDLEKAPIYFQSALDLAVSIEYNHVIVECLNSLGVFHQYKGNYQKAIEYFHQALDKADINSDQKLIAALFNNIGIVHKKNNQDEQALKYYKLGLDISRKLKDKSDINTFLVNIGIVYTDLNQKDKALKYYEEALTITESSGNKIGQCYVLTNMINLHISNNHLELANSYLQKAFRLAEETKDRGMLAYLLNDKAIIEQKSQNFYKAIQYSEESLAILKDIKATSELTQSYETLITNYTNIHNFQKAFEYKTELGELKDSLFNTEKNKQILELSTKYETEKKETENQLLKEQQAKNEAIISQQKITSFSTLVILVLLFIILGILYKNYQAKNRYSQKLEIEVTNRTSELNNSNIKLKRSNKELERFAYITSHDLKEPLRNIMSFAYLLNRALPPEIKENKNPKEYLDFIMKSSKQMHDLIEGILEYSKMNTNDKNENEKDENFIPLNEIIASVTEGISPLIKKREVELNIKQLPNIKTKSSLLFLILKNLIENGIKFNNSNQPIISIYGIKKESTCEISVIDNGIGIEKKYFDQIFIMFKRLHHREIYPGAGLGLAICKKTIDNIGGDIWVENSSKKGSKFTFSFPISEKNEIKMTNRNIAVIS